MRGGQKTKCLNELLICFKYREELSPLTMDDIQGLFYIAALVS